jgi:hypothetical protein
MPDKNRLHYSESIEVKFDKPKLHIAERKELTPDIQKIHYAGRKQLILINRDWIVQRGCK